MKKLTPKQEKFCHKYIETSNASEAYRQSYTCSRMKAETVNRKAAELMQNGKITARVQALQDELKAKSDITKEEVLDILSAILDSKITDYVIFDGNRIEFKAFDQLTERQAKAVEGIKQGRNGIELKLHGKSWTVERICKMLGFDAPTKNELTGANGKPLIPELDFSNLNDSELQLFHSLLEKASKEAGRKFPKEAQN